MRAPRRFRQFLAVSSFLLSCVAQAATTSPAGSSLFERRQLNPDTTLRSSSLWLLSASGTHALTPTVAGTYDSGGTWSPHGTLIAFQRGTRGAGQQVRYDVFVMDRQGAHVRQLSHGAGSFETPVWGPGPKIALIAKTSQHDCLSLVDVSGGRRIDLFCAPSPARLARPQWSKDGRRLFVAGGYYAGRLSPVWHGMAWRVDASTGTATLLADVVMDEERTLSIAPDGRHGIFADVVPNEMTMIDFATGAMTPVGDGYGYAPTWSKDGRRIAYTGEVYEFTSGVLRYYNPLYVMDADGRNVRRVTRARVDNVAYTTADWSDDGTHVLANVRTYADVSLTIPRYALRWIDVDSGALIALPGGYADPGAWTSH
jgi:Tol biopolymer transport system component